MALEGNRFVINSRTPAEFLRLQKRSEVKLTRAKDRTKKEEVVLSYWNV